MYTVQWTVYPKKSDDGKTSTIGIPFTIQDVAELEETATTELDEYCFYNDVEVVEGYFKVYQGDTFITDKWIFFYFGYLGTDKVS